MRYGSSGILVVILSAVLWVSLNSPAWAEESRFERFLFPGSEGADVKALQQFLKDRGFFTLSYTTNFFGNATYEALKKYQTSIGLEAVGQVGPKTLAALNGSGLISNGERALSLGMSGIEVATLQQFLKDKGFFTHPTITGYFGPITEAAVQAFQRAQGLEATGAVGPQTHAAINTMLAVGNTPETPASSSSLDEPTKPTLSASGGGLSHASGRQNDLDAPTISSVSTGSPTSTMATTTWTTSEPSNSQVQYGLTSGYGSMTTLDSALTTSHSVVLTGLAANTTYHYRVISSDANGNETVSSDSTFTTALAPPSGFAWSPPFSFYNNAGTYSSSFDIEDYKPSCSRTIYVGSGGNNSNDGLTYATRVRAIRSGISKANAFTGETVCLLVDPGEYKASSSSDSWSATTPTVDLVIEPNGDGQIYSIQDVTVPSFVATSDSNIYVSTYTTQTVGRTVIDRGTLDSDDNPTKLMPVLTVANLADPTPEINAVWTASSSAMFLDTTNKKIYVRLPDNRAPDSDVMVMTSGGATLSSATSDRILWMRNISVWGGEPFKVTGGTSGYPKVYVKDSKFMFSALSGGNGFSWLSGRGEAYIVDSVASWNIADGFNYHGTDGGGSPLVFESGNTGKSNGWDNAGTNNGSTVHESARIVRLNSSYTNNADRNVHDIQSAHSWNLAITSGPSRTTNGQASANFAAGSVSGTEATRMWLDGITSAAASNFDLEAYAGDIIRTANTDTSGFTNVTTGTITTYTP